MTTEDSTENMPDIFYAEKRISIGNRSSGRWQTEPMDDGDAICGETGDKKLVAWMPTPAIEAINTILGES